MYTYVTAKTVANAVLLCLPVVYLRSKKHEEQTNDQKANNKASNSDSGNLIDLYTGRIMPPNAIATSLRS